MTSAAARTTQDDGSTLERHGLRAPAPGLVLIHCLDQPRCDVLPLAGGEILIGRGDVAGARIDDPRMSRRHARVRCDGGVWSVEDLGSRNGTSVDGAALSGARSGAALRIVRTGSSVFLLAADVEPFRGGVTTTSGTVLGPTLGRTWEQIGRAARSAASLHIRGPSGTGKERAARAFHAMGPRRERSFIAVNCATIREGLAERLLFGARKGAYSGADADADGYVQAAHGGTLFLDEVAELDAAVQAKLLRVLEAKEVTPLGAARPLRVDFALVSATHKDLRAEVAAGKLREDLFFRIARPEVEIPPLRRRLEEVSWHIAAALREVESSGARAEGGAELRAHASLIEECVLRPWPGNVRELLAEARTAAQEARSAGSSWVEAAHLSPSAGLAFAPPPAQPSLPPASLKKGARAAPRRPSSLPDDATIEEALRREGGKVARAAKALGVHRTQLRRWIARRAAENDADP